MKAAKNIANKKRATKHMLSKGKKKMPTTGGYPADKVTIFSPASRGI